MPENPFTPELETNLTTALSTALMVEDILIVLDAYHQRESQKIQEIRAGITELNRDLMTQTALRLEALTAQNRNEYLTLLTQHLMALLDGGDGPVVLHSFIKPPAPPQKFDTMHVNSYPV